MTQRIAGTDSSITRDRDNESFKRPQMQTNRSKTVLIVEDEQDVIDLLAVRLLKDTSYTISTATDGLSALEKARSELPWLIILDLMLPKMSGLEVCKILKGDRVTREIPIIILSASDDQEIVARAFKLGALGFIPKTKEREIMLSAIELVLAGDIYIPSEILDRK